MSRNSDLSRASSRVISVAERIHPMPGNLTRQVKVWGQDSENCDTTEARPIAPVQNADVLTSEVADQLGDEGRPNGMHKPVLDLDFPAKLLDSSTPGHHHLLIDKEMSWEQYVKMLDVLAEVGILQQGYVNASKERKFTCVRLPWVKKTDIQPAPRETGSQ